MSPFMSSKSDEVDQNNELLKEKKVPIVRVWVSASIPFSSGVTCLHLPHSLKRIQKRSQNHHPMRFLNLVFFVLLQFLILLPMASPSMYMGISAPQSQATVPQTAGA